MAKCVHVVGQIVFWLSPQRNFISLIGIHILLSLQQSNQNILVQTDFLANTALLTDVSRKCRTK